MTRAVPCSDVASTSSAEGESTPEEEALGEQPDLALISVCDGIGAAREAFSGLSVKLAVAGSEVDEMALKVTAKRHPQSEVLGSIEGLTEEVLKGFILRSGAQRVVHRGS